jgi:hypothetical protein
VHKGQPQYVKAYPAAWRARIEAAILREATGGSQPLTNFFAQV